MVKLNLIGGVASIVIVGGFLGFLCFWLKAWPLIAISVGVMALAIRDLIFALKDVAETHEA